MLLTDERALKDAVVEIPLEGEGYPQAFRTLADPPKTLYAVGDISLLQGEKLAIVGSRTTPVGALRLGKEIAASLSEGITLVTGTADGGDTAAIEGALCGSGRIICVLAGGFSALPQCNLSLLEKVAKRGLLLALHPFEAQVRKFSYEYRNRCLAALSDGVFVLGAGEKSGALITARYAYKYKKPLFALPYPPSSASGCGCNAIIKAGGYLVESAEDVAAVYGIAIAKKEELVLSDEEARLCALLKEKGESHAGELASLAGVPVFKLRGVLSALEMKGVIVALGGNRYAAL